jgi:hypothetical protein
MDIAAILDLVLKAAGVISTLIAVGADAAPAIKVLTDLATGAKNGTVTDAQLAETESTLDGMISDFNLPMT